METTVVTAQDQLFTTTNIWNFYHQVVAQYLYVLLITAATCFDQLFANFRKLTRFVNAQSLHLIEETCHPHGDDQW